jgi:phosphoribosylformylglycinamidine cyclo-ligase
VLSSGLAARLDRGSWPVPPIFSLIQRKGGIADSEMYRVFNMGVGMVIICSPQDAGQIIQSVPEAGQAGRIVEQQGDQRVIIS